MPIRQISSSQHVYAPAAAREGIRYEGVVADALRQIFPLVNEQVRVPWGIIDILISAPIPIIVECKRTQTEEAYWQLERYRKAFPDPPPIRAVVTKTVVRTISTPERPMYLQRLSSLLDVGPGYYVIPFRG